MSTPATIARLARHDEPLAGYQVRNPMGPGGGHWWPWWPMFLGNGRAGGGRGDEVISLASTAILLGCLGTAIYGVQAAEALEARDEHTAMNIQGEGVPVAHVQAADRIRHRYVRYYEVKYGLAGLAAITSLLITAAGIAALAGYGTKRVGLLNQALRMMAYGAMGVGGVTVLMVFNWVGWKVIDRRHNLADARVISP